MAAAREMLLQEGVAASLERIAARAGVARATVFNQFRSKDELIAVVVAETLQGLLQGMARVSPALPIRDALLCYARNYVRMAMHPDGVGLSRLALSGSDQARAIAEVAYRTGYSLTVPVLASYLRAQIEQGGLSECNPNWAAERFFASVIGHSRHRVLLGMPSDSATRIDAFLRESVAFFLRAMSPAPQPGLTPLASRRKNESRSTVRKSTGST